jgi:hypothetical protein
MLIQLLLLAASTGTVPVVSGSEPASASPWSEIVDAHCNESHLRITRYVQAGEGRDGTAKVEVDGQSIRGGRVEALRQDLGIPGAVYRFQILCQKSGETLVRVNVGSADSDGQVRYRVATAAVSDGELIHYSSLDEGEESDAETFWYR